MGIKRLGEQHMRIIKGSQVKTMKKRVCASHHLYGPLKYLESVRKLQDQGYTSMHGSPSNAHTRNGAHPIPIAVKKIKNSNWRVS